MANIMGYETITTFGMDFAIADVFGADAVKDTFKRAFVEWKSDYKYLTELVLILNWKIWEHFEKGNEPLARVYNDLWIQADNYACENLKGDELGYFLQMTD